MDIILRDVLLAVLGSLKTYLFLTLLNLNIAIGVIINSPTKNKQINTKDDMLTTSKAVLPFFNLCKKTNSSKILENMQTQGKIIIATNFLDVAFVFLFTERVYHEFVIE